VTVSLADVLSGAAAHAVPLTAECAGYLVLAAADQAVLAPRHMLPSDLELTPDGNVRVARTRACEEPEAEQDLRVLLEELLLAASSVTPALLRTGRRANSGSIASLLREIETALIPVNRAAARRALARLQRETARALENGKLVRRLEPAPSAAWSPPPPRAASPPPPSPPPPAPSPPAPRAPSPRPPLVVELAPPPVSASPARSLPNVLTVPDDPVPPPTPWPASRIAQAPAPLPSLTPPPVVTAEVETRPEPVVLRASSRPPAPPLEARPTTPIEAKPTTPVLGTILVERHDTIPAAPPAPEGEPREVAMSFGAEEDTAMPDEVELIYLDEGPAEPEPEAADLTDECPPVAEEDPFFAEAGDAGALEEPGAAEVIEVQAVEAQVIEAQAVEAQAVEAQAVEAQAVQEAGPAADEGSLSAGEEILPFVEEELAAPEPYVDPGEPVPTPLILTERLALPIVPPRPRGETTVTEAEPPAIDEPEPSPIVELARAALAGATSDESEIPVEIEDEFVMDDVELAVLVEKSELPAWTSPEPEAPLTPPPRHALPKARPSDVDDLLGRLEEAPLAVDDLRSGLKRLAGLELTPPPLRTTRLE
jgi:hypothetical protein